MLVSEWNPSPSQEGVQCLWVVSTTRLLHCLYRCWWGHTSNLIHPLHLGYQFMFHQHLPNMHFPMGFCLRQDRETCKANFL